MYALMTQAVFRDGNDAVLMGRGGSMFLRTVDRDGSVNTLLQSGGFIRRDESAAETTNFLVAMNDVLAARGVRLLVARHRTPRRSTAIISRAGYKIMGSQPSWTSS